MIIYIVKVSDLEKNGLSPHGQVKIFGRYLMKKMHFSPLKIAFLVLKISLENFQISLENFLNQT